LESTSDIEKSISSDSCSNSVSPVSIETLKDENERLTTELQHERSQAFTQRQFYENTIQTLNLETTTLRSQNNVQDFNIGDLTFKDDLELQRISEKLIMQLQAVTKVIEDRKKETCVICLINSRSHVLIPCGHKLFCGECAGGLLVSKICPMCRTPIQSILKVFG